VCPEPLAGEGLPARPGRRSLSTDSRCTSSRPARPLGAIRDNLEVTCDTLGFVRRPIAPTCRWLARASHGPPTQTRVIHRDRWALRLTTLGRTIIGRVVRLATRRAHVPSCSEAIGRHSKRCRRSFRRGHRDVVAIAPRSVQGLRRVEAFANWGLHGSRRANATLTHGRAMPPFAASTRARTPASRSYVDTSGERAPASAFPVSTLR
jgi:hypothetical protein